MTGLQHIFDPLGAYACPRTGAALTLDRGLLCTEDGTQSYPIHAKIPTFLCYEPAESDEDQRTLERLNAVARKAGWRKAIAEVYGSRPYVTDESRLIGLDLLDLDHSSAVLEVGSSLGQFTAALATRCGVVYGLEVVPGQASFALRRCLEEGRANVHIACGGDDCRLPYRDGAFDAVVINLVIEWCYGRERSGSPSVAQRRLLEHAHRVLRPGGQLYLATKNRFALRYLIGRRDEHAWGIRFGNAMPRWMLGLALKMTGRDRPQGLLHSHNALERMLRDAGFAETSSFWAAPEMRYPTQQVPTHPDAIRAARREPDFVEGESRSTRLLMPLVPARWVRHVTPGLTFVATK